MIKKAYLIASTALLLASLFALTKPASAACATMPTDKGSVTVTATAPSSGNYYIWSRNKSTTNGSNAYYLQIDSTCGILVGDTNIPLNTWTWVSNQDGSPTTKMSATLSSGTHIFKMYGVDPSLIVDRVLLTADANCVPTGGGDNCINTSSPPPPTIITPGSSSSNTSVGGTLQVGSGNANTRIQVTVDGKEIASGRGLIGLDTSKLSDGFHDITITTINPDGSTTTTTKRILVRNHLLPWQRAYNWLYRSLNYNKGLTDAISLAVTAALLGALLTAGYLFWTKRLWERLIFLRNVHLHFLRVPAFLQKLRAAPVPESTVIPSIPGAVVVGDMSGIRHHVNRFKVHIMGHVFNPDLRAVAMIAGFTIIGSIAILYSSAGANSFVVDPDQGNLVGGATKVNDPSAANGSYIQFGTGSVATCPSGQTGTPPNCVPATCPAGQTGTPPNCVTPPATFVSQCLARTGQKFTISGPQNKSAKDYDVKANSIYDVSTATWNGLDVNGNPIMWMNTMQGVGPSCWYGGSYNGPWDDTDPAITWQNPYHHSAAFTIRVPNMLVEGYRANNQGDGINIESAGANFHLRALYLSNMHDDCIQNDSLLSGLIEDSLFEGCYTGFSEDDFTQTVDGSANTLTIQNNLVWIKPMPTVFRGTAPGNAFMFKGWSQTPSSKVALKDNIFLANQAPGFGASSGFGTTPGMNMTACSNNIVVWTGPGAVPPGNYPANCFTITKDISVWNNAVAKWKTAHPNIR